MESTVYRRDSDGKVIGTPEVNRLDEQPVFSVSTYRAGEIGNTQIQPEIVADKPQPLPVNPEAVKSSPKIPAFKLERPETVTVFVNVPFQEPAADAVEFEKT